eukprot:3113670-Alexandrium_andersonii.AAC.1
MSASLVGSEMCIRDSVCPEREGGSGAQRTCSTAPRAPGTACRTEGGRAVSYTHLTLPTICSV